MICFRLCYLLWGCFFTFSLLSWKFTRRIFSLQTDCLGKKQVRISLLSISAFTVYIILKQIYLSATTQIKLELKEQTNSIVLTSGNGVLVQSTNERFLRLYAQIIGTPGFSILLWGSYKEPAYAEREMFWIGTLTPQWKPWEYIKCIK